MTVDISVGSLADKTSLGVSRDDLESAISGEAMLSDDKMVEAIDAVISATNGIDLGELAEWLVEQSGIDLSDYESDDDEE